MNGAKTARTILAITAVGLVAAGLSACRDDEQGRPLSYDKGVYGGQAVEPLTEEQHRQLQQRTRLQGQ